MDRKTQALLRNCGRRVVALIYLQFRTWKNFDWQLFLSQTHNVSKYHISTGLP